MTTPTQAQELRAPYVPQPVFLSDPPAIEFVTRDCAHVYERVNPWFDIIRSMDGAEIIGFRLEHPALVATRPAAGDAVRRALEPFAQKMTWPIIQCDNLPDDTPIYCELIIPGRPSNKIASFGLHLGDFRRAREALSPAPAGQEGEAHEPAKRIEVDIGAAFKALQESPELCQMMNEMVGGPALVEAQTEIDRLRADLARAQAGLEKIATADYCGHDAATMKRWAREAMSPSAGADGKEEWQLVPKKPTPDMRANAQSKAVEFGIKLGDYAAYCIIACALAAAPQPQEPAQ